MLWATSAVAQQPDVRPYESEEDLWEALSEREITFDEFLELLDIHRVGADGTILPQSDWEQLPGSDAGYLSPPDSAQSLTHYRDAPAETPQQEGVPLRWSLRSGYDADLIAPTGGDGYTIARLRYGTQVQGLIDWRHTGTDAEWRRRLLIVRTGMHRVELGNVEPRWGRGLVIGRRSRFFVSNRTGRADGSFLQPTRSRFNGLMYSVRQDRTLSGSLLISDIHSDLFNDRLAGAQIRGEHGLLTVAVQYLAGSVERRDSAGHFTMQARGISLKMGDKDRVVLGEIAQTDGGATAKAAEVLWPFTHGRLHARAWSYDNDFINPWGGGPAHADRETVLLDGIDENYSSRTTGERGFSLTTKVKASQATTLRWEWMTHKESPNAPVIHHWTIRLRLKAGPLSLTPFARGRAWQKHANTHALGFYSTYGDEDRRIDTRLEFGRHHVDAERFLRLGIGGRWRLNRHVRFAPRIRWVDPDLDRSADGYWYLYFTETIIPGTGDRIEAALVWQRYEDRKRGDRIELRLRSILRGS